MINANFTNFSALQNNDSSSNGIEWDRLLHRLWSTCAVLAACVGCVTNTIIIIVFVRFKEMRKLTHLTCLWLLAIFDLLRCMSGIVFQAVNLFITFGAIPEAYWMTCAVVATPVLFSGAASLRILSLIPFDRLLAVARPFKYRSVYKHRKRQLIVGLIVILFTFCDHVVLLLTQLKNPFGLAQPDCWQFEIITTEFFHRYVGIQRLTTMILLVVGSILMAHIHFRMYIHPLDKSTESDRSIQAKKRHNQMNKTVLVTLTAAVVFVVLPTCVWQVVRKLAPRYSNSFSQFAAMNTVLNSTVNIFLYAYRIDDFRVHMKKLLLGRNQDVTVSNLQNQRKAAEGNSQNAS